MEGLDGKADTVFDMYNTEACLHVTPCSQSVRMIMFGCGSEAFMYSDSSQCLQCRLLEQVSRTYFAMVRNFTALFGVRVSLWG